MLGPYDAVLVLSFGGPEGPEDVVPFLRNVTRGRGIPDERLAEVGAHYELFGGRSPINDHNRALMAALGSELATRGHDVPVAWGNRNWHPLLADTLAELRDAGASRVVAVITSAFSSYSGCRQYLDDIDAACEQAGGGIAVDRIRVFWNHPGFLGAVADRVTSALSGLDDGTDGVVLFTAHSLPASMAAGCDYEVQLAEAAGIVLDLAQCSWPHEVVFQSRSGPPQVPWLEPDVGDRLVELAADGVGTVVCVPLGFVSDHMEVVYDLDTEAAAIAEEHGVGFVRVPTVGTHPVFVSALVDLVEEAAGLREDRPFLGTLGPRPDRCAPGCCPAPARRPG